MATKYEFLEWQDRLNLEIWRLEPDHNYSPLGRTVRMAVKNLADRGDPKPEWKLDHVE